jgi:hypothetical protein
MARDACQGSIGHHIGSQNVGVEPGAKLDRHVAAFVDGPAFNGHVLWNRDINKDFGLMGWRIPALSPEGWLGVRAAVLTPTL